MKGKPPRPLGEDAKQRISNQVIKTGELWIKICLGIGRRRAQKWNSETELEKLGSSPEKAALRKMLEEQIEVCEQDLKNMEQRKDQLDNLMEELSLFEAMLEAMAEQGNLKGLLDNVNRVEEAVNNLYSVVRERQSYDD